MESRNIPTKLYQTVKYAWKSGNVLLYTFMTGIRMYFEPNWYGHFEKSFSSSSKSKT
jgi:hypothetical protein